MTALDQAWAEWMKPKGADGKISQGERWRQDNPGQWAELKEYRSNGGTPPSLTGNTGRQMVYETTAWLAEQETPPVEPPIEPPVTGIAPPQEPITRITNVEDTGVNCTTRKDLHDIIIDGTGDTGVLFQKDAGGSTLKRVKMTRVAALNTVSWGKHAIYAKAPDLLMEDIDAQCSGYCASCFSLRFDGAILRRAHGEGAPHIVTYYETSGERGEVLVEDLDGSFTNGSGAIWMDAETDYQDAIYQEFTFRRCRLTGPSSAKFLAVSSGRMQGAVIIEDCTLNGKPVTPSMVSGVPDLTVR